MRLFVFRSVSLTRLSVVLWSEWVVRFFFVVLFSPLLVFLSEAFGVECHHNISIIASHPAYEAASRSAC